MASSAAVVGGAAPGSPLALGLGLARDVRAVRRHLLSPNSSHAPAPNDYAFTRLLGLLDALHVHTVEAAANVPANQSAVRLNSTVLWGVPAGGWNASCETLSCASASYRAFLSPLFWQTRTRTRPNLAHWWQHRRAMTVHGARPVAPFISMISGEDLINDCPSCGARASFAFWQHAKYCIDWLNEIPSSVPYIGVGNSKFPSSQYNQQFESNQQQLYAISAPPYVPQPIPQILIFVVWLLLFICIQVLFWWIMNPWWDMFMLAFMAYGNALWQTCDGCGLKNCPAKKDDDKGGGSCTCVDGKPTCNA